MVAHPTLDCGNIDLRSDSQTTQQHLPDVQEHAALVISGLAGTRVYQLSRAHADSTDVSKLILDIEDHDVVARSIHYFVTN